MSELLDKQLLFGELNVQLGQQILELGYRFKPGECKRSNEQAVINAMGYEGRLALCAHLEEDPRWHGLALSIEDNGKANGILMSAHRNQLAIDIDLFKDAVYLATTEDHRPIGEWWEKLNPLCRWGGRWGDGNHYSLEHAGIK